MCTPRGPVVCYKYEDCGPPDSKANEGPQAGGSGAEKNEKGHQLKRIKSRELRGGIMYYSCHCIKRNGLQHDCRRTGCGGEPSCVTMDDPVCSPSQLARARGLAAPLASSAHGFPPPETGVPLPGIPTMPVMSPSPTKSGGKKYIVCEVKTAKEVANLEKLGGRCSKCDQPSSSKPR